MKTTYVIKEVQNVNADCDGEKVVVKSLRGAKISASRRQLYRGTTMKIEGKNGALIAYKEDGKNWVDCL